MSGHCGKDSSFDWRPYFDAVRGQPPRDTLLKALDAFDGETGRRRGVRWRVGVDIGCGEGRDLREILGRRYPNKWKMLVCDASWVAIDQALSSLTEEQAARCLFTGTQMEQLPAQYSPVRFGGTERLAKQVDFVNASFSLPFCDPEAFPVLWTWIVGILKPGGRFAGQLFGLQDEWAQEPRTMARTFHQRSDVERLLGGLFSMEYFEEVERDGKTATGEPKHWHVFHIVARKGMDPTEGSRA